MITWTIIATDQNTPYKKNTWLQLSPFCLIFLLLLSSTVLCRLIASVSYQEIIEAMYFHHRQNQFLRALPASGLSSFDKVPSYGKMRATNAADKRNCNLEICRLELPPGELMGPSDPNGGIPLAMLELELCKGKNTCLAISHINSVIQIIDEINPLWKLWKWHQMIDDIQKPVLVFQTLLLKWHYNEMNQLLQ